MLWRTRPNLWTTGISWILSLRAGLVAPAGAPFGTIRAPSPEHGYNDSRGPCYPRDSQASRYSISAVSGESVRSRPQNPIFVHSAPSGLWTIPRKAGIPVFHRHPPPLLPFSL
ncbi:protein of unknown function [Azospirillum baldaniorum]|uniref:Uncharacterized protein n=1 Tax=Azospirillum baldaniorum TaxID=1064539 RepID=A0A9P1NKJ6_9PROT|nr:protein of unknown function [Azospirillum baldaniorum]